jgi:hypothetical protein
MKTTTTLEWNPLLVDRLRDLYARSPHPDRKDS